MTERVSVTVLEYEWCSPFGKDFDANLKTHVYESYSHEQQYTDGTIFRNILKYAKSSDMENEKKWRARLSTSKQKDLKQLLADKRIRIAFENLIDFVGLWPPIQLGKLHLFHGLKCAKVLECNLTLMLY